jgi:hypothetical protein
MSACKSYGAQLALLSVEALNDSDTAAVRKHLRECEGCREYIRQLEGIVGLYAEDAQRPVVAPPRPRLSYEPPAVPWLKRFFAAPAMAAAVVVIIGVILVGQRPRQKTQPSLPETVIAKPAAPLVPTIGNARHLALDNLTEPQPSVSARPAEFVFSVKTRDDGS